MLCREREFDEFDDSVRRAERHYDQFRFRFSDWCHECHFNRFRFADKRHECHYD